MPPDRLKTVADLAGTTEYVDVYLRHPGPSGKTVMKGVRIVSATKAWVSFVYSFRGVCHRVMAPHGAIVCIDHRTRALSHFQRESG